MKAVDTEYDKRKGWVCKGCKKPTQTLYVVTGHDHTDSSINICGCGYGTSIQKEWDKNPHAREACPYPDEPEAKSAKGDSAEDRVVGAYDTVCVIDRMKGDVLYWIAGRIMLPEKFFSDSDVAQWVQVNNQANIQELILKQLMDQKKQLTMTKEGPNIFRVSDFQQVNRTGRTLLDALTKYFLALELRGRVKYKVPNHIMSRLERATG